MGELAFEPDHVVGGLGEGVQVDHAETRLFGADGRHLGTGLGEVGFGLADRSRGAFAIGGALGETGAARLSDGALLRIVVGTLLRECIGLFFLLRVRGCNRLRDLRVGAGLCVIAGVDPSRVLGVDPRQVSGRIVGSFGCRSGAQPVRMSRITRYLIAKPSQLRSLRARRTTAAQPKLPAHTVRGVDLRPSLYRTSRRRFA